MYFDPECGSSFNSLNHAVLAVGYGKEDNSDYWLVKNSWGTTWGDKGYVKMAKFRANHCGKVLTN